ncbi:hypothetical protein EASAB2608_02118 [Streptomyces sp. EAS-AB2608]|nr:hypothetical protein EASAB2608_02118 [Streptomyces sp. EAS-AB2608]
MAVHHHPPAVAPSIVPRPGRAAQPGALPDAGHPLHHQNRLEERQHLHAVAATAHLRPEFAAYLRASHGRPERTRPALPSHRGKPADGSPSGSIGHRIPGAFRRAGRYEGGAYTLWLYARDTRSWASADCEPDAETFEDAQSGPRRLWNEVEDAYRMWEAAGRPGFDRVGLTVAPDGQTVWLDDPEQSWSLTG